MTIRKGAKVVAPGILAVLTVDEQGPPTALGPIWICVWENTSGRKCRRGFLASVLTLAPAKTSGRYNQDDDLDNLGYGAVLAEVRAAGRRRT